MTADTASPFEITTHSADETRALGETIGRLLRGGDVLALVGNLGAGKTTFTQGIGAGLGIKGYMRSPTFTLVNEYELANGEVLFHLDGYRLGETLDEAMLEAESFGMEYLFDDERAVIIVEWADRVATILPPDRLQATIEYVEEIEDRLFILRASGPRSQALLEQLGR